MKKERSPSTRSSPKEIATFVRHLKSTVPQRQPINTPSRPGRLMFGLDATASRHSTWERACHLQVEMFSATEALGGLEIQLTFYRGSDECKSTDWISDTSELRRKMMKVTCLGGLTQIRKILAHTIKQNQHTKINALVFIGDSVEESEDMLCNQAGQLGLLGVPVFVFQEGKSPNAMKCFKQIASLSGGVHCLFDHNSPSYLKSLLGSVAAYAVGGLKAVQNYNPTTFLTFQKQPKLQ